MDKTTMDDLGKDSDARRHAPATVRNRDAIAAVLARELPKSGTVLEVASGSGEHAVFFARQFPALRWQPSDPDPDAIASIAAWQDSYEGGNCAPPVVLDAQAPDSWPVKRADAIVCINMVHISPWSATQGLFHGAAQILSGTDLPLVLYGPYFEQGVEPAPSNLAFDVSLKTRNPAWGIRSAEDLSNLGARHGFARTARHEMPANNLMLVFRRA